MLKIEDMRFGFGGVAVSPVAPFSFAIVCG